MFDLRDPTNLHRFVLGLFAVYGLLIGSFLNVVIHRLPLGLSIVRPRSRCPDCGHTILWYENIPLLSYLALRGRCRGCGLHIPARYPAVELLTALVAVATAYRFLPTADHISTASLVAAGLYFCFAASLIAVAFIDADHMIIPNVISLPGIPLGVLAVVATNLLGVALVTPLESIVGLCVGGVVLYLVLVGASWIMGQEAMGMGDVKLMAMVGAWLGAWPALPITVFLGSLGGAVFGIVAGLVTGTGVRGRPLPFGPWLVAGALVALLWGDALVGSYLALLGIDTLGQ